MPGWGPVVSARPLQVAVLGAGRMGARHARTVAADPRSRLVAVVDTHPERAADVAERTGAEARQTVPEGVEAVVVATPTSSHAELAARLLAEGRWVLVEKPITRTAAEAEALVHPRCAVAHVERFNPAVRATGPVAPRFVDARRLVPFTRPADDLCVVKDLMVHDLDLLLHWTLGEVTEIRARGLRVRTDEIDVASVTLRTACGVVANLLASRIAAVPERITRVYESQRTTWLDLLGRRARRGPDPLSPPDERDGLRAQWDAFVAAVHGEAPVAVGPRDGWRVVALAERIRAVMERGDRDLERAGRAPARA